MQEARLKLRHFRDSLTEILSLVPGALGNENGTATGSLDNDKYEVSENGKKAIGLDWQNNNSARASSLFVHFFAVTARL